MSETLFNTMTQVVQVVQICQMAKKATWDIPVLVPIVLFSGVEERKCFGRMAFVFSMFLVHKRISDKENADTTTVLEEPECEWPFQSWVFSL